MHRDRGFTLVELLVTLGLISILMTLGAASIRQYVYVQSLYGARDLLLTELRALQQRSVSESHPVVYGAQFRNASSQWRLVQYLPDDPTTSVNERACTAAGTREFDNGTHVHNVSGTPTSFLDAPGGITAFCRSALSGGGNDFVFFFARGDATAGQVSVRQPQLDRALTINVSGPTGRVDEL